MKPATPVDALGMRCICPRDGDHRSPLQKFSGWLLLVMLEFSLSAAESIDESKLPPPVPRQVDFSQEVQPIFEKSCFRCHGPEKPKSRFRLDSQDAALRGGAKGVDIVPGQSTKSPLIHYVARLPAVVDDDMAMPPEGKGDPLTSEQVGILRAWIDQGAAYPGGNLVSQFNLSISPAFAWISVHGDKRKFRENEWVRDGWNAGVEPFDLQDKFGQDSQASISGHALRDDYKVELTLEKSRFAFFRAGFLQFRKYYDDTGGFYEFFDPPSYSLDRDLHLDIGKAWFDVGLTLPDAPRVVLGYEYDFRRGAKSTLQWGNVGGTGGIGLSGGKNLYPAAKDIDEQVHILKLDVNHEIAGWSFEDNARVEFYDLRTYRANVESFGFGPRPDSTVNSRETAGHVQGLNTLRIDKQVNDWLFLSGGYFYSRIEGDAAFNQSTMDAAGLPAKGTFWYSDEIVLRQSSHIFSLSSMVAPADELTVSAAVQNEWMHQEGLGRVHLDSGDPYDPATFNLEASTIDSNLDKRRFNEELIIRSTKLPFTTLYAEARLSQEGISQTEGKSEGNNAFDRDTDASNNKRDFKVGFAISPWTPVSLNASYKNGYNRTDYRTRTDLPAPGIGYPAFIRERKIDGDELQLKLALKPTRWLKTTLTYRLVANDYQTATDPVPTVSPGGRVFAGKYDAHIYAVNATLTPMARLYLSTTLSYSDFRTVTAQSDHPSIIPYRTDVYSAISSASFALNPKTDLSASYFFSRANYDRNQSRDAVPSGLDYVRHGLTAGVARQLSSYLTANLRYAFYDYSEPGPGHINDYTAHGIFASFQWRWR